jgi:hypothetical protein
MSSPAHSASPTGATYDVMPHGFSPPPPFVVRHASAGTQAMRHATHNCRGPRTLAFLAIAVTSSRGAEGSSADKKKPALPDCHTTRQADSALARASIATHSQFSGSCSRGSGGQMEPVQVGVHNSSGSTVLAGGVWASARALAWQTSCQSTHGSLLSYPTLAATQQTFSISTDSMTLAVI